MTSFLPETGSYSAEFAPQTICLLRLSALGDITHVLPTLRTLQTHWPQTKISWIIGRGEYQLVKQIPNVDFIVFDKAEGLRAYWALRKKIKNKLGNKKFDVLFHLQLSLRASIASLFVPAKIKLGFDEARAKDMQYWFCNHHIKPRSTQQHVLDSFLEFPQYFSLKPVMKWQLPVSDDARNSVTKKIKTKQKIVVINPCAVAKSKNWRNWHEAGYANIADYLSEKQAVQVVISGGSSALEKQMAEKIIALCQISQPINLVAKTSIDELVALLSLAELVVAPDTGPVHIASALNTKTIGLYATTNPQRAGPYNHQQYRVNKYPEALIRYNNTTLDKASWGERIKTAEAMNLILVEDVKKQIDRLL